MSSDEQVLGFVRKIVLDCLNIDYVNLHEMSVIVKLDSIKKFNNPSHFRSNYKNYIRIEDVDFTVFIGWNSSLKNSLK